MNETNQPNQPSSVSDVPWPTSDHRVRVPDTSVSSGTENAPSAPVDSLNRVVQGAHDAVDRFADSAEPKVRQLSESVSGAEAVLRARAEQLGAARDKWADNLRGTVRSNPLAAIAAALAVGAVIARVIR